MATKAEPKVMEGVTAQPLHEKGVCQIRRDGGLCASGSTGPEEHHLWRVTWGDGVVMDLCTRCMGSLVFEE